MTQLTGYLLVISASLIILLILLAKNLNFKKDIDSKNAKILETDLAINELAGECVNLRDKYERLLTATKEQRYAEYDIRELMEENKLLRIDSHTNARENSNPNHKLMEHLYGKIDEYKVEIAHLMRTDPCLDKTSGLAKRTTQYISELEKRNKMLVRKVNKLEERNELLNAKMATLGKR